MRRGERFPDDQAEVAFCDAFVQQLGELTESERAHVLGDVVRLCDEPAGKHPLAAPLSGWNTLEVLSGHKRVVYKATVSAGTGLIEVLCVGPRSDNEVVAEAVGLDGWDYQPPLAPVGMVRAVVAAGPVLAAFVELATPDHTEPADRSANMRAGAANALNGWG